MTVIRHLSLSQSLYVHMQLDVVDKIITISKAALEGNILQSTIENLQSP